MARTKISFKSKIRVFHRVVGLALVALKEMNDFCGKIEGSQLKKFYTFLLSTQLYQKKRGRPQLFQFQKLEIEFSSLQKVFFYQICFKYLKKIIIYQIFEEGKKNNRALHTDAEKLKKTAKNPTIQCFLCNIEVVFRGRISYFPKFHLYLLSYQVLLYTFS